MDDAPGFGVPASPSINSVLKPPKPRIPLKELMPAAHEEDNTAAQKRRVSFANVNKIKEFSAGAESMVVCHTPAYEEPFSFSSDSSCPSGVDVWTPAKCEEHHIQATFSSTQKENVMGQSLFIPQIPGYGQIENLRSPDSYLVAYDGMDLTSCVGQASARFSGGMDLTEVIMPTMNDSRENMELTKGAAGRQSYQPSLYTTDMNISNMLLADESDALELTDAIADPKLIASSTKYSSTDMDLTRNLYSVNNTRYSVNGMDLTRAAMSLSSSAARRSTRYSLTSMDLTEAIGNNCSGMECTEVISEPKIVSPRYSVNDMDFTETINRDNRIQLYINSMDSSGTARNKLESSINFESSMDFTRPVYSIHQTTSNFLASTLPSTTEMRKNMEQLEDRKSLSCPAVLDSLELNDNSNDSEDTPTTQTYNDILSVSASKDDIAANVLVGQEEKKEMDKKKEWILEMDISVLTPEKITTKNKGRDVSNDINEKYDMNSEELKDDILEMNTSVSTAEKIMIGGKDSFSSMTLDQETVKNNRWDENPQTQVTMELPFSESNKSEGNCSSNKYDLDNNIEIRDKGNSCMEEIEKNLNQIDNSLNNLTSSSDSTRETSITNIPCCSNITMTRGSAVRYSTGSHDLAVETSMADISTQPSELESSMPLFQNQVMNMSGICELGDMSYKGRKRSFEIALESENDSEKSPVKQICLPNAIHLQDCEYLNDISAPSFSMDNLPFHYESVHISTSQTDIDNNTDTLSQQIEHEENTSFGSQRKEVGSKLTNDKSCDSVDCFSVSKLDILQPPISKNILYEPSISGQVTQPTLDHNLFSKETTASKRVDNLHLKASESNHPAFTLKTTCMFRKHSQLRKLQGGLFGCDLIPNWIELQFSAGANGIVSNPVYKLVCSEREMAIGEYVLQQVKSFALPADVHSLITEIREPRDSFPSYLAKNLSLIWKYLGGTLKGNILTLELVNCKQKFWTFVDVNTKYPKYVSAEDITISEQRIGELKLTIVRNIFRSIATGPNQLRDFATALSRLQYG